MDDDTGAPIPAIILTWALAVLLTLSGTFQQLLVLGVVARFAQYIPTTLAVLVLRRRPDFDPDAGYTIPGGPVVPLITLGLCAWLLYEVHSNAPMKLFMGAFALYIGAIIWSLQKRREKLADSERTLESDRSPS